MRTRLRGDINGWGYKRGMTVGKSTVSEILKDKKKWLEIDDDSHEANKKKRRNVMYNDIDQALAIWVEQSLNANIDLSGKILKEKGKVLLSSLIKMILKHQMAG